MPQNGQEVSETDLYLLSAIEKLVYRVDYMEKRLRKTEQLVYYLMAGNNEHKKEIYGKIYTLFHRKTFDFNKNLSLVFHSPHNDFLLSPITFLEFLFN